MTWEGGVNPAIENSPKAQSCLLPMGITSENVAAKFGLSRWGACVPHRDASAFSMCEYVYQVHRALLPWPHAACRSHTDCAYWHVHRMLILGHGWELCRKEQDEFAAASHRKAAAATQAGKFKDEIVPVHTTIVDPKTKEEKQVVVAMDDGIREGTSATGLGKLRAVFKEDGSTTAGNSSQARCYGWHRRDALSEQLAGAHSVCALVDIYCI
jgi:Thiolase, N-terminal domain